MKRLSYFLIALGVFVSDRLTKLLIEEGLGLYEIKTVIPGFLDLTHTRNTGMAFGILSGSASPLGPGRTGGSLHSGLPAHPGIRPAQFGQPRPAAVGTDADSWAARPAISMTVSPMAT